MIRTTCASSGSSRASVTWTRVYDAFIEGFRERYGVSPLAVLLDTVSQPRGQGRTPRLGVVLERTDQYRAFVQGPFRPDKHKQQAVAILFTESLRLPCRQPGLTPTLRLRSVTMSSAI